MYKKISCIILSSLHITNSLNLLLNLQYILDVVKRNPLFLHEIEWKNNGFLFITPNTMQHKINYVSHII